MLFYDKGQEQTMEFAKTTKQGLTDQEAEKRLKENGKNMLKEAKKKSWLQLFFGQMKDLMIIVLLLAAAVSAIIAIVEKQYFDLIDSGIILVIVVINSIIGVVQQEKADKSMEMLKNMNKPYTKVLRNGELKHIKSEDLVVGDIVVLEAGDSVSADLRLIETCSLKIEEATLIGESLPVEKDADLVLNCNAPLADRKNMAFSSTTVTYGSRKFLTVGRNDIN